VVIGHLSANANVATVFDTVPAGRQVKQCLIKYTKYQHKNKPVRLYSVYAEEKKLIILNVITIIFAYGSLCWLKRHAVGRYLRKKGKTTTTRTKPGPALWLKGDTKNDARALVFDVF
jgi:hypothetical protein